jgi:ABC transport permease subunit
LNLKNSFVNAFTWESLFIVGRRYWIHHWFGVYLAITSYFLEFGAVSMPSMVSISIIREIGPIITALICAGRIGSGIGAELGSMRVTEQIDAMEVSGTNPFKYLVVTRIMATTLMLPILVFFGDAIVLSDRIWLKI